MIADSTTQDEVTSEEETSTPPYRHLNLNQFLPNNPIGISDEELVSRPIKEINKTFKSTGKEVIISTWRNVLYFLLLDLNLKPTLQRLV